MMLCCVGDSEHGQLCNFREVSCSDWTMCDMNVQGHSMQLTQEAELPASNAVAQDLQEHYVALAV